MNKHLEKMIKSWKKRKIVLSDQQLSVADWVVEDNGSLELMARAGCGKTFTLMRIVELIAECGFGDVALMAYNKKIADELKEKLAELKYDWRVAQAGTVHSFGFGAWRKVAPGVKVDDDKVINIISQCATDQGGALYIENMGAIKKLVGLGKQKALGHFGSYEDTSAWLDIWEHFNLDDDVTEDVDPMEVIRAAIRVYRISLNRCREIIDFDDMIFAPLYFKARFWPKDWILLDESQDTNPARRALALAMLKPQTGRMIFVGDDCQAIYGFTGADSDSMQQLKTALNAKTLPLNVTRRCPRAVVEMAKKLVPDFTAHDEAPAGIVRDLDYNLLPAENLNHEDAILCRNTAPLVSTAYSLISKGIGCRVEGKEIGEGLIKLARRWKVKTLDKLLIKLDDHQARMTAKFMSKNQERRIEALADQCDCLRVVINRCLLAKKNGVDDLVEDIQNMFGNTPDGAKPNVTVLSTAHKSKGREWKRVYILGRQRFMPSPYAKKEWQMVQEKNLEYVAITRSMSELIDVPYPEQEAVIPRSK